IAVTVEKDIKERIHRGVLEAKMTFVRRTKTGTLVNLINKETQTAVVTIKYLSRYIAYVVGAVILLCFGLWTAFWVIVGGLVLGAAFLGFMKVLVVWTNRESEKLLGLNNKVSAIAIEDLQAVELIQGMNLKNQKMSPFSDLLTLAVKVKLRLESYKAIMRAFQEPAAILVIGLMVFVLKSSSNYSIETSLIATLLLYRTYQKLMGIQEAKRNIVSGLPSYDLCSRFLEDVGQSADKSHDGKLIDCSPSIMFSGVGFSYSNTPVFKSLDWSIKENELVVVLGPSGSGKSTLVRMLLGFLEPDAGSISVSGLDFESLDIEAWRESIGLVLQETVLLNGTIKENILIANPRATEQDLNLAVEQAGVRSYIDGLSNGYNTQVGERGAKLSGGQKQRLALARAFIRSPRLLILDEPTSSLDSYSAKMINEALERKRGEFTSIIFSHRKEIIDVADAVYQIDQQRIRKWSGS
ncbi:MAG: ABC transporter ATP-binding protein, partial [Gammaproteobacteria bacterium]